MCCASDILQSCIWFNTNISDNMLFFPDWFEKGIYLVADVLEHQGKMLCFEDLNEKFNCNLNILNFYTIRSKLNAFLSRYKVEGPWDLARPIFPLHLKPFFSGSRWI